MRKGLTIRACAGALIALASAACTPAAPPLSEAAARGQQAFVTHCGGCHLTGELSGSAVGGPSLGAVFGRRAGTTDFAYSPAMRTAGETIVWNRDTLDQFLTAPRDFVPNNQMAFFGMPDAATRADIIEFLATQTPN
jgi:cytochrome c